MHGERLIFKGKRLPRQIGCNCACVALSREEEESGRSCGDALRMVDSFVTVSQLVLKTWPMKLRDLDRALGDTLESRRTSSRVRQRVWDVKCGTTAK